MSNLPTNRDGKSLANRLRRLSDNCGGKVLSISAGCAVLRFGSREAAERASKRMENEDVFGSRISVSLCPRAEEASGPLPAVFVPVEKPRSPRRLGPLARLCQGPPRLGGASRKVGGAPGGPVGRSLQVSSLPAAAHYHLLRAILPHPSSSACAPSIRGPPC